MIEIDVRTDNSAQVPLVKDNNVAQELSTGRSDKPFTVRILPRTPRCGDHLFDFEIAHTPTEPLAVDVVAIAIQVFWCSIEGNGLDYLLPGPLRRRMRSDVEVDNAPTFMGEHGQDKQNLKLCGRHHKEVDRDEFLYVIVEKRLPGRRRAALCPNPVFLHGRHGELMAQRNNLQLQREPPAERGDRLPFNPMFDPGAQQDLQHEDVCIA